MFECYYVGTMTVFIRAPEYISNTSNKLDIDTYLHLAAFLHRFPRYYIPPMWFDRCPPYQRLLIYGVPWDPSSRYLAMSK